MANIGATYEIKEDKTFIYIDEGERYEFDITSFVIDEVNQIVTIITDGYWDGCTVQTGENINVFEYILIYDNEQITNICLLDWDGIYWQNNNGIIADLEGTYVNETRDRRIILNPEEKSLTFQYSNGTNWSDMLRGCGLYLKVNGQYWIEENEEYAWNSSFVIDENTLLYEGKTYIKENE